MSGGSPEQALLSAACGQMAHFYDLTGGTASGMSDSKIPDAQAGMEKGINHALVGNAGANLIYESAGMHASLLGFCLESLVLDNDIIGAVQRTIRGIEVNEESIAVETIRDVCLNGPGHYLGSDQTLKRMQTEYVYPVVGTGAAPTTGRSAAPPRGRPRHAEDQGDPAEALSAACLPGSGRCGAGGSRSSCRARRCRLREALGYGHELRRLVLESLPLAGEGQGGGRIRVRGS
jgi:Trimethylamine:corrinoid methyltransferase